MAANLKRFLNIFPSVPSYAFAYGSKVKAQANLAESVGDMIDLIIAVDDPLSFHKNNMEKNPSHYSFLRHFGHRVVSSIQEKMGARIYYNTMVPVDGSLIKYGIIGTDHLINDLLDWETLYVSGRLHKPVEVLQEPNMESLKKALDMNFKNALHTSLLLLDETFTEEELYITIGFLSYSGDFRMIIGEDKNKVSNIVKPQVESFRNLYLPYLTSDSMSGLVQWHPLTKSFSQSYSNKVFLHHLNLLPKQVQQRLYINWTKNGATRDLDDVLLSISQSYGLPNHVRQAVRQIVTRSSLTQSAKGILTAGVTKSTKYVARKLRKMWNSL